MAILYPASLANLVVEVGTRHCHQTLLVAIWQKNRQRALWQNWELMLANNFGNLYKMVTKFGSQLLATKFGFVPDCWKSFYSMYYRDSRQKDKTAFIYNGNLLYLEKQFYIDMGPGVYCSRGTNFWIYHLNPIYAFKSAIRDWQPH